MGRMNQLGVEKKEEAAEPAPPTPAPPEAPTPEEAAADDDDDGDDWDDDDDWDKDDDDDDDELAARMKSLGIKKDEAPKFDDEEDLTITEKAANTKAQNVELKKKGNALTA